MLRNLIAYTLIGIGIVFGLATAFWGYQFVAGSMSGAFVNQMVALVMTLLFSGIGHKIKEPTSDPS